MVDDESRMRKLVSDFLTRKGYIVIEAGDGEEALDRFYADKDISLVILDVDAQLDAVFGKEGTPERKAAEDRANAFFTGQIIEEARKKANMTQAELAEKIGTNKSYISRVETGKTEPKVSTFYRIASALGLNVELTPAM